MRGGHRRKKLIGAARHWAARIRSTGPGPDTSAEAAAALGAPPEILDRLADRGQTEPFDVLETNWPTVTWFLQLQPQWARSPMGALSGLRWESVRALLEVLDPEHLREVMRGLLVMEHAALEEIARE